MTTIATRRRLLLTLTGGSILLGAAALWPPVSSATSEAVRVPPPAKDAAPGGTSPQKAIFAGGCFWGVQGVYQHVKGVQRVLSGYSGGVASTATYEQVSSGRTGHAESVEVTYDPAQVSYGTLLRIFFSVAHDPTQLNRQGPDVGTQYRSAIFATSAEQFQLAQAYVAQLDTAKVFGRPIATKLESTPSFFAAEAYHQDYMTEHPQQPYIVFNDLPKVEALKQLFPERFRSEPVLVKAAR